MSLAKAAKDYYLRKLGEISPGEGADDLRPLGRDLDDMKCLAVVLPGVYVVQ